jgi:hypothetical protein
MERVSAECDGLMLSHPLFDGTPESLMQDSAILASYISKAMNYSPLVATRAYELSKLVDEKGEILKEKLKDHLQRLKWNLIRIYRIRNEIVHNGRFIPNLETVTGHTRYYLTFSLSRFIDFFSEDPLDLNLDGKWNSEDFFVNEKMVY